MKFSVSLILAASAIVAAAPTTLHEKRTFQSILCHSGTGSIQVPVNTVVTNALFTPLNLQSTILGVATQCNNQILATLGGLFQSAAQGWQNNLSAAASAAASTASQASANYNAGSSGSSGSQGGSSGSGGWGSSGYIGSGTKVSYGGSNANAGSSSPYTGQGTTVQGSTGYTGSGTTVSYSGNNQNTGSSNQYSTGQGTTVQYNTGSSSSGSNSPTYQRQQFTQNLVAHMRQQYPNYSVVACVPGQYQFSGTPIHQQTVQCSTSAGNQNYDVVVYNKGTCKFNSQSGFENYAFVPNPTCQYSNNQVAC